MTELKAIPPAESEAAPAVGLAVVQKPEPVVEVSELNEIPQAPVIEVSEAGEQPAALVIVTDTVLADVPEASGSRAFMAPRCLFCSSPRHLPPCLQIGRSRLGHPPTPSPTRATVLLVPLPSRLRSWKRWRTSLPLFNKSNPPSSSRSLSPCQNLRCVTTHSPQTRCTPNVSLVGYQRSRFRGASCPPMDSFLLGDKTRLWLRCRC